MASLLTTTVDVNFARIGVKITGFPSDDPTTVYRRNADGTGEPEAVRGAAPMNIIAGAGFQWDYEAESGQAYIYFASDGSTNVMSPSTKLTLPDAHIVAVGRPAYNVGVLPEAVPATTRKARSVFADVIGRRNPVALTDVRAGLSGSLSLITVNDADSDRLDEVLTEAQVLFVQLPGSRFGARYVLVGDVTETPFTGVRNANEGAMWELDITEVDKPGGDLAGDPAVSYQLLASAVPTFDNLLVAAPTYLDLRSGIGLDTSVKVPTFVGAFGAATAAADTVATSATLPTFASGDLAVAIIGNNDSTQTMTTPTGWIKLGTDLVSGTGRYAFVYKTLTTDTTVSLLVTGTTQKFITGSIYRTAKVIGASVGRMSGSTSSVTATSGGVSTTQVGAKVVRIFAAQSPTANASWSLPPKHTLRGTYLGGGANSMSAMVCDRPVGPVSTVASESSNRSIASASWVGWSITLQTP